MTRPPVETDRERRTGDALPFSESLQRHLRLALGKVPRPASAPDLFSALALATGERILDLLAATEERFRKAGAKRVGYLSAEFLIGRSLRNNLSNLDLLEPARAALRELGSDLDAVCESEPDPGLGSGGLGRLAACFLDSLASLDMPGTGYGIDYEHGLFRQVLEDGQQRERPDSWRASGTPWLFERRREACSVPIYGRTDSRRDPRLPGGWIDREAVVGVPSDLPIVGCSGRTANVLRLYSARAIDGFDMSAFHAGHHLHACERQLAAERISKVIYPAESSDAGRELRLLQEYFLVSCALQDVLRRHLECYPDFENLPEKLAIQLNDTHPSLAVAELVRLLVDEHRVPFERAWEITRATLAYTNHTLMPEALERWPWPLFQRLLPRHLMLIELINLRFLQEVAARWPGDLDRLRRTSIVEEGFPKHVRMANLAIVGSHAVNGVSKLHSELMRRSLVPDFHDLWPERFQSKTNGISPRRWLRDANPGLARLITSRIGDGWLVRLERLSELERFADDPEFLAEFAAVKSANKAALARTIEGLIGVAVDPASMFDVQIKRIHEYKRQLLAVLHVVHAYLELVEDGRVPTASRTWVFAGKAAPDYWMAKLVLKLIWNVARVVNQDPRTGGRLRVALLPNYRVALAERIVPAADLSEQISTAGTEASGTGNMKLALNGALTIGTFDGANIEILEAVGPENMYVFGRRAEEIAALRASGGHDPRRRYEESPRIRRCLDALIENRFSPDEPGIFRPVCDTLLVHGDPYFVLADIEDYLSTQERVGSDFASATAWARRAALNVARMGRFSSDRTIREYAAEIWGIAPVP